MAKNTCTINGCERFVKGRGWCGMHYHRYERHGDPVHPVRIMGDDMARFLSRIQKTDDCWYWLGGRDPGGYGTVRMGGKMVKAHRYAYQQWVGPIPAGLDIDHVCRRRCCVNPSHLDAVTRLENVRRAVSWYYLTTHCRRGHELDGEHLYVSPGGKRVCRTCRDDALQRRRAHVKG